MNREPRPSARAAPANGDACARFDGIDIDVATVLIEFQSSGRLMPWLGPAVRGVVAGRFRERHCVLPLAEQAGRWRRCRGCAHLRDCDYGRIFEPDEQVLQPPAATAASGQDVPRAVVLAPAFPAPVRAERGLRLPLSIVAIGTAARAALGEVVDVLAEAGRAGVFGTDRLMFAVVERSGAPMRLSLDAASLPDGVHGSQGVVPRVRVVLTTPLFLRDRDAAGRPVPCRAPSLHRLVRAAVDTVAAIAFMHGVAVASDSRSLVSLTRDVRTVADDWRPFDQEKHSNRSRSRFDMRGVVGEAVYADVPRAVLPWLALAGQLHVGGHRVAGAGAWRMEFGR
jgi:hypothetical protein